MEDKPITYTKRIPDVVIRQRNWTEQELRAMGYEYFKRKKEVVMMRVLPADEAPLTVVTSWGDELVAKAGYVICYEPGPVALKGREDYQHWPVAPDIFHKTYQEWDEPNWRPTQAQKHLLELGCKAYYKTTGVWAKQLTHDAYLQSMEHEKPVKVSTGRYVVIGVEGEPYSMGEGTIASRYDLDIDQLNLKPPSLLQRIKKFFKIF